MQPIPKILDLSKHFVVDASMKKKTSTKLVLTSLRALWNMGQKPPIAERVKLSTNPFLFYRLHFDFRIFFCSLYLALNFFLTTFFLWRKNTWLSYYMVYLNTFRACGLKPVIWSLQGIWLHLNQSSKLIFFSITSHVHNALCKHVKPEEVWSEDWEEDDHPAALGQVQVRP